MCARAARFPRGRCRVDRRQVGTATTREFTSVGINCPVIYVRACIGIESAAPLAPNRSTALLSYYNISSTSLWAKTIISQTITNFYLFYIIIFLFFFRREKTSPSPPRLRVSYTIFSPDHGTSSRLILFLNDISLDCRSV